MNKKHILLILLIATVISITFFIRNRALEFPDELQMAVDEKTGAVCGEFRLKVKKYLNHETTVRFAIPAVSQQNQRTATSPRMLFYAPFNGEADRLSRSMPTWLKELSRKEGVVVFSLTINADTLSVDNHKKYYIYKESGWHEIIFQIQEYLEKKLGLNHDRLLVFGQSSGGSLAQQLSVSSPEKIERAAWNGGSRYATFKSGIDYPPLLASSTWGCYGQRSTDKMAAQGRELGVPIEQMSMPPKWTGCFAKLDFHEASPQTLEMLVSFVMGREYQTQQLFTVKKLNHINALMGTVPNDIKHSLVFLYDGYNGVSDDEFFLKTLIWEAYHLGIYATVLISSDSGTERLSELQTLMKQSGAKEIQVISNCDRNIDTAIVESPNNWPDFIESL